MDTKKRRVIGLGMKNKMSRHLYPSEARRKVARLLKYEPEYKVIPALGKDFLTPLYDFLCGVIGLGQGLKKKILQHVPLNGQETVLDIGCGTGVFLRILKERYPNIRAIGVDPDLKILAIAARRLKRSDLDIELKHSFAESLPLENNSVDVCFSTLVFHHLPDDVKSKALEEIRRVLKEGGRFVLTDFGKSKFPALFGLFENLEYLRSNLKGLIPQYIKDAGFRELQTLFRRFPNIESLLAHR